MPEAALHVSDITFGFAKGKPLFENLSCSLSNNSGSGKIIALMGPSGVGKTTFCDLALGIRKPQKGIVRFDPPGAHVAVIPQKGVIFDELSVAENISCLKYSKTLGSTFRVEMVDHAVQSLGLLRVLQNGTSAAALSGGEAQRVMLARIQTVACDLLILDEPCSFLDNRVKDSFLGALRATVDELGLLALMVTHVWEEARLVADEVVFFHQVPEAPVRLHRSPTAQAASCPPTIDALFSIHWPDCLVLEIAAETVSARLPAHMIPKGACSVGLYRDPHNPTRGNEWARGLWNPARESFRGDNLPPSRPQTEPNAELRICATFYGSDGTAISNHQA